MRPLLCLAALAASTASAQAQLAPVTLDEVLRSAESSYPLLLAAIQERAMAQGKELSALGAFDTKLDVGTGSNQFGYYKHRTGVARVEQPLADWGGELFGGYKRGQGNYGPWQEDLLTLSGGEWSGGLRLPLLRSRETDERRTDLLLSRLGVELADASIESQRLRLLEMAAKSYWSWVAAGANLEIAEAWLALAEARVAQVEEAVAAGEIAEIEIADNQRAVYERRAAVVSADRELQNATFELSLFLRDGQGQPRIAGRERLPPFPEPEPIPGERLELDLLQALDRRPEVGGTLVELRQNQAALGLARNRLLPQVDFTARYGQHTGVGSITKQGGALVAGVALSSPFQRRKAKGEVAIQEAKLTQLDQRLRFARNRIEVEVRDAFSALEAALARLELARQELGMAVRLADAERERFELGDSTLFMVNLRELSAASARLRVAGALADCHKARAEYRAAIAGF